MVLRRGHDRRDAERHVFEQLDRQHQIAGRTPRLPTTPRSIASQLSRELLQRKPLRLEEDRVARHPARATRAWNAARSSPCPHRCSLNAMERVRAQSSHRADQQIHAEPLRHRAVIHELAAGSASWAAPAVLLAVSRRFGVRHVHRDERLRRRMPARDQRVALRMIDADHPVCQRARSAAPRATSSR